MYWSGNLWKQVSLTSGAETFSDTGFNGVSAGTYTVTAIYGGDSNNNPASVTSSVIIGKATPTASWAAPASITYGTALSSSQLDASASVPGTFTYSPAAGAILPAGPNTLSATFVPTDQTDYATVTAVVTLSVSQAPTTLSWPTPTGITYGTPLSAAQLNASASIDGTFTYGSPAGTILGAGTQTLVVSFTPSDQQDYAPATGSVQIAVAKATPSISWPSPSPITYNTPLATAQLSAKVLPDTRSGLTAAGAFAYTPAAGTVLSPGVHALTTTFTPSDSIDYIGVAATTYLTVEPSFLNGLAPENITTVFADPSDYTLTDLYNLNSIAVDQNENLYLINTSVYNSTAKPTEMSQISSVTGQVTMVAGGSANGPWCCAGAPGVYDPYPGSPAGVNVDSANNLYIFDNGTPTTLVEINPVAGLKEKTFTITSTSSPYMAADQLGNIYFLGSWNRIEEGNNCIVQKLTVSTGTISTVAGINTYQAYAGENCYYNGDSIAATSAALSSPAGLAVDSFGDLYIADAGNNRIREVAAGTGIITTVAGNGINGFYGDGGLATSAELSNPLAIAVDSVGNLYIADTNNFRVRMVSAGTGVITTIAGNGSDLNSGDGGLAARAGLSYPTNLALDSTGHLYISETYPDSAEPLEASDYEFPSIRAVAIGDTGGTYITDVSPPSGGVGSVITITGPNFGATEGNGSVTFNGVAASVNSWSPQVITATVPAGATSGNVVVITEGLSSNAVPFTVLAAPVISWAPPAPIVYGTPLTSAQLNATSSVAGTFAYSPAAGTVLPVGTDTLSVVFTPTNTATYADASATASLTVVAKSTPAISWTTPTPIAYGTPLSAAQLDASAPVPGTFSYSPALGAIVPAGTDTLSVTFTPTDTADYTTATKTVVLNVTQAVPVITWVPAAISYGTPLSSLQLNATASVPGTFTYSPAAGIALPIGLDTLSVTFTPTNSTDYASVTTAVQLAVTKAVAAITWPAPAPIAVGTALSATQLNATASIPGTFVYSPVAGTVLPSGSNTLTATFTPSDTTDYSVEVVTVTLSINLDGGAIKTVAGTGVAGYNGDGGAATSAEISLPTGIARDAAGDIYFADNQNNRIRKVTPSGTITTVAGTGTAGYNGDGIAATAAEILGPLGVAIDSSGNLYFSDQGNARVREVNASTGIITTVAGNGLTSASPGGTGSNPATQIELCAPDGLAFDAAGDLYIADSCNSIVREVNLKTGQSSVFLDFYTGKGSLEPTGVAIDSTGNIYVAAGSLFEFSAEGFLSTVAGGGPLGYSGDGGPAANAGIGSTASVAVDSYGNVYFTDGYNNIRKITAATGIISTVAGSGVAGYSGDGGASTSARLSNPLGVASDPVGNIFITDAGNSRIRYAGTSKADPSLTLAASPTTIPYGSLAAFTATLSSAASPTGTMTFQINGSTFGTVTVANGSATYNMSNEIWSPGTYTIMATYSGDADNNSATAKISFTVTGPQPPNISSIVADPATIGTQVTITGDGFGWTQGSSTVTFNGVAATPTSWAPGSIVATVPAGSSTGDVVVTVNGTASNGFLFMVIGVCPP